jgi:hypothetical protein
MVRRFVVLIIGSAVLAAALALFCRLVFLDVSPYMPGEDVALGWRREAAFLTTTLAWLSAEVSVVLSVGLIAWLREKPREQASIELRPLYSSSTPRRSGIRSHIAARSMT